MKKNKIISLVGLMGVGKTTIGYKLAQKTGFYFIDSDQEIIDKEGKNIDIIFATKGEKYFREIEKKIISEILIREENIIFSLGGGAFMDEDSRKLLKEKSTVIWLKAELDSIIRRTFDKVNRPLLNKKNKREVLRKLMKLRYPQYEEAHFKYETDKQNSDVIVNKIINDVVEKWKN